MTVELPSQTQIANNALSRIGSGEVLTSIDDPTSQSARRVRSIWPQLRRAMLARHPFNFAIRRRLLNPAGAGTPGSDQLPSWDEGLTGYQLPEDCLRWLPPAEDDRHGYEGEREGNFILVRGRWQQTDGAPSPLPCRYIADIDEVPTWSPGFVEGFTEALAKLLAQPVTQSATMAQGLHDTAEEAVRLAKRLDGLETGRRRRSGVAVRSDWLSARSRGYSSSHR
jgi:hypothetical protein